MSPLGRIRLLFALNGAEIAIFGPFASVVLASRGFGPAEIGLVSALTALAFVLSVSAWGHLGDVVLGRSRALRYALLGAAGLLVVFMLPLPQLAVGAAFVAYAACYGAVGPLSDALAVNALRDPGREYGRVRVLASAAFAVVSVAVGLLYGVTGYWPAGPLFVALAIAIALLAGRLPDLGRAELTAHRRGGAIREVLAIQPALPGILLAMGLGYVGVFAGFTFLSLRIVELGGGAPQVALSSSVAAATEVAAMLAAGRLVPRIGIRALFVGSVMLHVAAFLLWAVLASPEAIIASRIVSGAGYSGMWIASVVTIQALLPPRLQGSGQALVSVTTAGVAAFVANVVGGVVFGSLGTAWLFGIAAIVGSTGAALGWRVMPRRGVRRFPDAARDAPTAPAVQPDAAQGPPEPSRIP